jgi:sarcosine oxidase subunit gamma
MRDLGSPALLNLRLDPSQRAAVEAVGAALGLTLPEMGRAAVAGGTVAYRLGPDEWWIATDGPAADLEARLRAALGEVHAAVTEIGEGWSQIEVSGPCARDLLAKGCPLDFHPRRFAAGEVKQSLMSKADCVYRLVTDEDGGGPLFELTVRRSFADYVWRWLAAAAREYGLTVLR